MPRNSRNRNTHGRTISRKRRLVYLRRRILAAVAAIVALALIGLAIYGITVGVRSLFDSSSQAQTVKKDDEDIAKVPDCTASNITLDISATPVKVGVGGSVEFTVGISHQGKKACLVDGSDAARVLTITEGDDTVWRSDSCPVSSRLLLMGAGDRDQQTITWNTNRTGDGCQADSDLPKVPAGTYVATVSMPDLPKVQSVQVPVIVQ